MAQADGGDPLQCGRVNFCAVAHAALLITLIELLHSICVVIQDQSVTTWGDMYTCYFRLFLVIHCRTYYACVCAITPYSKCIPIIMFSVVARSGKDNDGIMLGYASCGVCVCVSIHILLCMYVYVYIIYTYV